MRPLHAEHPLRLTPCPLRRACTQDVPNPIAGAAVLVLAGLRARCPAGAMPAKRQHATTASAPGALAGVFQGAATREGADWGCAGAMLLGLGVALLRPQHPVGGIAVGSIAAAACPGSRRGAGAVEWGSRILWCPEGAGKVLVLLPACWIPHRTATTALCFPALSPPSRSQGRGVSWVPPQVFMLVPGAEGMCPWRGGTDAGTLLPALAAIVSPGCEAACPGHGAEGR